LKLNFSMRTLTCSGHTRETVLLCLAVSLHCTAQKTYHPLDMRKFSMSIRSQHTSYACNGATAPSLTQPRPRAQILHGARHEVVSRPVSLSGRQHAHCTVLAATLFAYPREHRTHLRVCTRWGCARRIHLQLHCPITTVMSPLPRHTPYAARRPIIDTRSELHGRGHRQWSTVCTRQGTQPKITLAHHTLTESTATPPLHTVPNKRALYIVRIPNKLAKKKKKKG